jgi:hypothetical protein
MCHHKQLGLSAGLSLALRRYIQVVQWMGWMSVFLLDPVLNRCTADWIHVDIAYGPSGSSARAS